MTGLEVEEHDLWGMALVKQVSTFRICGFG
jgi:hypothetical protein